MCSLFRKFVATSAAAVLLVMPLTAHAVAERFTDVRPVAQSDLGGGTNFLTSYGVTRKAIVDELSTHEHDSYYLGTPYAGGDVQSPNGDISYNGSAGMNRGGFVGYVLRKVGLDSSVKVNMMSVVHATSTAVNMKRSIARAL